MKKKRLKKIIFNKDQEILDLVNCLQAARKEAASNEKHISYWKDRFDLLSDAEKELNDKFNELRKNRDDLLEQYHHQDKTIVALQNTNRFQAETIERQQKTITGEI